MNTGGPSPLSAYRRSFWLSFAIMVVTTLVATRTVETRGRNVYAETPR